MSRQLEIVAVGARTPVGLTAEASAAAVRAAVTRLEDFPFAMRNGEPLTAACDSRLPATALGYERLRLLLLSVLDEVIWKLDLVARSPAGLHVLLSVPEHRPGFSDHDATRLTRAASDHFRTKGVRALVEIGGQGHAGAILAVERAMHAYPPNEDVPMLIAGVDSYLDPQTLVWLDRQRLLPQPSSPNGFIPGEAAGCLVLTHSRLRKHLGWPCLAILRGVGTSIEMLLRDSDTGSLGEGMTQATLQAVSHADSGTAIDTVYLDINGERYRSEEWGFVALRTGSLFRSLDYEAPSASWGDVGAAWATLAGVLAARSFVRGYARGARAMVMAGSMGGLRGAMILEAPPGPNL